ncbi:hypothetical protein CU098_008013 [Rhizopus stolonifer]|uniref:Uncharacterized protein n=1 Tax=Rhizopus stolonifer TaxID=4846 RepID=A0A367JWT8_RHIST|nr:hypothetical protein CU098_008013 [Rhizopus stolonifer]
MTEAQDILPETASVDAPSEDYVTRFTNQKTTFLALIAQLNNERIELLIANDIEKIDSNTNQLNSAIETVKNLEKLIASEKESRAQSEAISSPVNRPDIPHDQLPKFEVDPNASALYKLTRSDNDNSTVIQTVDSFLQEFEKKLRNYNVLISEHWFHYLDICFQKSDTVSHHDWFNRIIKKPMTERQNAMTWKQAKEALKVRFDYTYKNTPTMWMKHLLNYKQSANESMTKTLRRFYLYCVGSKISTDQCPLLISLFVSKLYTVRFQNLVTSTVEDFVKLAQSANHPAGSVLTDQDALLFDMSWEKFEYIIIRNIDMLEDVLQQVFEQEKTAPKLPQKKRKLPLVNTSVNRKTNITKTTNNNKNDLSQCNNAFQNGNNAFQNGNNAFQNGNNAFQNDNNTSIASSSNSRPNYNDTISPSNNSHPSYNDMTSSNGNSHSNHNDMISSNSNGRSIHNDTIPFNRSSSSSRPHNHSETSRSMDYREKIAVLRSRGICTLCQTEKYSPEHMSTCYARNRMDKRRQERQDRQGRQDRLDRPW